MILFIAATTVNELPVGLLSALCFTESSHRVNVIHHDDGNGDSLGVCQIKLNTAKMLGFKGTSGQLMDPKTNIHYAALYLKKQMVRYQGDSPRAVAAYSAGRFNQGPVFALNQNYVDKVFDAWSTGK